MTLQQLITALSTTVLLTVQDKENNVLLKFYTKGDNTSLATEFLSRTVFSIALISNSACTVVLDDVEP